MNELDYYPKGLMRPDWWWFANRHWSNLNIQRTTDNSLLKLNWLRLLA